MAVGKCRCGTPAVLCSVVAQRPHCDDVCRVGSCWWADGAKAPVAGPILPQTRYGAEKSKVTPSPVKVPPVRISSLPLNVLSVSVLPANVNVLPFSVPPVSVLPASAPFITSVPPFNIVPVSVPPVIVVPFRANVPAVGEIMVPVRANMLLAGMVDVVTELKLTIEPLPFLTNELEVTELDPPTEPLPAKVNEPPLTVVTPV